MTLRLERPKEPRPYPHTLPQRLKAVNPNAENTEDTRTPEEILDFIEAKGREVAEAIAALRRAGGQ